MTKRKAIDPNDREALQKQAAKLEVLLQEAGRRHLDKKIQHYIPHEKQRLFHASTAKHRLLLGGNRSGKTHALIAEAVAYAMGYRAWDGTKTRRGPSKILIAGEDFLHAISGSVVPTLDAFIPSGALAEKTPIEKGHGGVPNKYNFANGSFIQLFSYQQEPGSVEGFDWDFVGYNEPPPRWFYIGCLRGLIDRGGVDAFAMTPLKEPWIFEEVYAKCGNDPDFWSVFISQDDNPHLSEEEKRTFRMALTPEEVEARVYGKFFHLMGRVFPTYDPLVHGWDVTKRPIDPAWPKGMVVDPHTKKPFAVAWFALTPQGDIVFFEEWPKEDFYRTAESLKSIPRYSEMFNRIEERIPGGPASISWRIMDPNYGRTNILAYGETVAQEFYKYGFTFDTTVSDDIDAGHLMIARRLEYDNTRPVSAINRPTLFIASHLRNMNQAFLNYQWVDEHKNPNKDAREKVKERFKDFIDLVRYTCMFDPHWVDTSRDQLQNIAVLNRIRSSRLS